MKRADRARQIEKDSRAQGIHPEIGPCLDPAIHNLSLEVANWRPDYRIGDKVRQINPIGAPQIGTVLRFYWHGTHIVAVVKHDSARDIQSEFAARIWAREP